MYRNHGKKKCGDGNSFQVNNVTEAIYATGARTFIQKTRKTIYGGWVSKDEILSLVHTIHRQDTSFTKSVSVELRQALTHPWGPMKLKCPVIPQWSPRRQQHSRLCKCRASRVKRVPLLASCYCWCWWWWLVIRYYQVIPSSFGEITATT